ncbi:Uncharacterised protein [Candidatus Gugararchaeum adminiculabundum]|nr:Uncharacterised protein [Candidatus Gugararchaeum adminiculabundum]
MKRAGVRFELILASLLILISAVFVYAQSAPSPGSLTITDFDGNAVAFQAQFFLPGTQVQKSPNDGGAYDVQITVNNFPATIHLNRTIYSGQTLIKVSQPAPTNPPARYTLSSSLRVVVQSDSSFETIEVRKPASSPVIFECNNFNENKNECPSWSRAKALNPKIGDEYRYSTRTSQIVLAEGTLDPNAKTLTGKVKVRDRAGTEIILGQAELFEPGTTLAAESDSQVADANVNIYGKKVRSIRFHGLDLNRTTIDLSVDNAPNAIINGKTYLKSFSIDTTGLNFTSATVTYDSTGGPLYKCKDWNFATSKCLGEWVTVPTASSDILGYMTFEIFPGDPLYTQGYTYNFTLNYSSVTSSTWTNAAYVNASDTGYATCTAKTKRMILALTPLTVGGTGDRITSVVMATRWKASSTDATDGITLTPYFSGVAGTASSYFGCSTTEAYKQFDITSQKSPWTWADVNSLSYAVDSVASGSYGCGTISDNYIYINVSFVPDATGPTVQLTSPANITIYSGGSVNFTYNVTDASTIANCTLWVDNVAVINDTTSTFTMNTTLNFTYTPTGTSTHTWNIQCTDTSFNKNVANATRNYTLIPDTTAPVVTLLGPATSASYNASNVTFYYSVTDLSGIQTCSLFLQGNAVLNRSMLITNQSSTNFTQYNLPVGTYNWSVKCTDNSTFQTNSATAANNSITITTSTASLTVSDNEMDNESMGIPPGYSAVNGIGSSTDAFFFANYTDAGGNEIPPKWHDSVFSMAYTTLGNITMMRNPNELLWVTAPGAATITSIKADLRHTGVKSDVIVVVMSLGLYAYDQFGNLLWTFPIATTNTNSPLAIGDFDKDGYEDDTIFSDGMYVYIFNESGDVLANSSLFYGHHSIASVAVADFDGDGYRAEAAVAAYSNDTSGANPDVVAFMNGSLGNYQNFTFASLARGLGTPRHNYLALGDFDSDGYEDDLAVATYSTSTYAIKNDSTLIWNYTTPANQNSTRVAAIDYSRSGIKNGVVAVQYFNTTIGYIAVLNSSGQASCIINTTTWDSSPNDIVATDFDSSGYQDDFYASIYAKNVSAYNSSCGPIWNYPAGSTVAYYYLAIGNLDENGYVQDDVLSSGTLASSIVALTALKNDGTYLWNFTQASIIGDVAVGNFENSYRGCTIYFADRKTPEQMSYNSTGKYYYYERRFYSNGTKTYNIDCQGRDYDTKNASGTTYVGPPAALTIANLSIYTGTEFSTLGSGTQVCSITSSFGDNISTGSCANNLMQGTRYRAEILVCNDGGYNASNARFNTLKFSNLSTSMISTLGTGCGYGDYGGAITAISSGCSYSSGTLTITSNYGVSLPTGTARSTTNCKTFAFNFTAGTPSAAYIHNTSLSITGADFGVNPDTNTITVNTSSPPALHVAQLRIFQSSDFSTLGSGTTKCNVKSLCSNVAGMDDFLGTTIDIGYWASSAAADLPITQNNRIVMNGTSTSADPQMSSLFSTTFLPYNVTADMAIDGTTFDITAPSPSPVALGFLSIDDQSSATHFYAQLAISPADNAGTKSAVVIALFSNESGESPEGPVILGTVGLNETLTGYILYNYTNKSVIVGYNGTSSGSTQFTGMDFTPASTVNLLGVLNAQGGSINFTADNFIAFTNSTWGTCGNITTANCAGQLSSNSNYRTEIRLCNDVDANGNTNATFTTLKHSNLTDNLIYGIGTGCGYGDTSISALGGGCAYSTGTVTLTDNNALGIPPADTRSDSNCEWFAYNFTTGAPTNDYIHNSSISTTGVNLGTNPDTNTIQINLTGLVAISFTVSYPSSGCSNGKGCATGGCSACTRCWFETTDLTGLATESNVNCEGQSSGTAFFRFTNTGSSTLKWQVKLESALPATFAYKMANDTPAPAYAQTIGTSFATIKSGIAASAYADAWAYGDFNTAPGGSASSTLTVNGTT